MVLPDSAIAWKVGEPVLVSVGWASSGVSLGLTRKVKRGSTGLMVSTSKVSAADTALRFMAASRACTVMVRMPWPMPSGKS
ncbi:hypothetical protein D3C72_706380 [compost metagenome]